MRRLSLYIWFVVREAMTDSTALPQFNLADYAAAQHIAGRSRRRPAVGLVLGSGLDALAEQVEDAPSCRMPRSRTFPSARCPATPGAWCWAGWVGWTSASCRGASTSTKGTAWRRSPSQYA